MKCLRCGFEKAKGSGKGMPPICINSDCPPLLTKRQEHLALLGKCPWCEENIRVWVKPQYIVAEIKTDSDGIQYIANRIDSDTGHKLDCEHKDIKL